MSERIGGEDAWGVGGTEVVTWKEDAGLGGDSEKRLIKRSFLAYNVEDTDRKYLDR